MHRLTPIPIAAALAGGCGIPVDDSTAALRLAAVGEARFQLPASAPLVGA